MPDEMSGIIHGLEGSDIAWKLRPAVCRRWRLRRRNRRLFRGECRNDSVTDAVLVGTYPVGIEHGTDAVLVGAIWFQSRYRPDALVLVRQPVGVGVILFNGEPIDVIAAMLPGKRNHARCVGKGDDVSGLLRTFCGRIAGARQHEHGHRSDRQQACGKPCKLFSNQEAGCGGQPSAERAVA